MRRSGERKCCCSSGKKNVYAKPAHHISWQSRINRFALPFFTNTGSLLRLSSYMRRHVEPKQKIIKTSKVYEKKMRKKSFMMVERHECVEAKGNATRKLLAVCDVRRRRFMTKTHYQSGFRWWNLLQCPNYGKLYSVLLIITIREVNLWISLTSMSLAISGEQVSFCLNLFRRLRKILALRGMKMLFWFNSMCSQVEKSPDAESILVWNSVCAWFASR